MVRWDGQGGCARARQCRNALTLLDTVRASPLSRWLDTGVGVSGGVDLVSIDTGVGVSGGVGQCRGLVSKCRARAQRARRSNPWAASPTCPSTPRRPPPLTLSPAAAGGARAARPARRRVRPRRCGGLCGRLCAIPSGRPAGPERVRLARRLSCCGRQPVPMTSGARRRPGRTVRNSFLGVCV